jgi:LuxR family maltose regulon positive regulatory protein
MEPLQDRIDDLRDRALELRSAWSNVTAPLTPAELRVLAYLPTYLTFTEIAEDLFVSRNTVKTQAISIYRKLGVSARTPAVQVARAIGLLASDLGPDTPDGAERRRS